MAKRYRDHEGTWKQVFFVAWSCQKQVRQLELVRDALSDGRAKLELMRQARKAGPNFRSCVKDWNEQFVALLLVKQQYKINHTEEVYYYY